ncbi:MAG: hypothetical protein ACKOW8_09690, partial [Flavobacteriales bacterium]
LIGLNNITSYYNKPKNQLASAQPFNSSSIIEVCMDIYHAYMNDLQLYLIGPESCGRPVITLAEGITSTDSICPQIFADPQAVCFSNTGANNFNYCQFSESPGTYYNSYGWNNEAIIWDSLFGCDMNENDWHVQVSDCFGEFIGEVSQANVSFTTAINGIEAVSEYVLSTPAPVIINNCDFDTTTLSPFNRYLPSAAARGHDPWLQLFSNPPIPGLSNVILPAGINGINFASYNLTASKVTQNTYFYAEIIRPRLGSNVCGHPLLRLDSSFYDYIEPDTANISGNLGEYCVTGAQDTLESGSGNGFWTGPGMDADSSSGIFFPNLAGVGNHSIIFRRYTGCKTGDTIVVAVDALNTLNVTAPQIVCDSLDVLMLNANITGPNVEPSLGIWSGNALINDSLGWVNPAEMILGSNEYVFSYNDGCIQQASLIVDAEHYIPIEFNLPDSSFCSTEEMAQYSSNVSGTWSGPGILSNGTFNPGQSQEGNISILFNPQSICYSNIIVPITVVDPLPLSLTLDNTICDTLDAINIVVNYPNGIWTGADSVSQQLAVFPVSQEMSGLYPISYVIEGVCIDSINAVIDVEDFEPLIISLNDTVVCATSDTLVFESNYSGVWSGPGIVNSNGLFFAGATSLSQFEISFIPSSACHTSSNSSVAVVQPPNLEIDMPPFICSNSDTIFPFANFEGGQWTASFSINPENGGIIPTELPAGQYELSYTLAGVCTVVASNTFDLIDFLPVIADDLPHQLCALLDSVFLYTNQPGQWIGEGIISDSGWYSPALLDTGNSVLIFNPTSPCVSDTTFEVNLVPASEIIMNLPTNVCLTDEPLELQATPDSGTWSGLGIAENSNIFYPTLSGASEIFVEYSLDDICNTTLSQSIIVVDTISLALSAQEQIVCPGELTLISANLNNLTFLSGNTSIIGNNVYFNSEGLSSGDYWVQAEHSGVCYTIDEISIHVFDTLLNISPIDVLCIDAIPVELESNLYSGIWSGSGVVDDFFHADIAGVGSHTVHLQLDSICSFSDSVIIEVQSNPQIVHSLPAEWCDNAGVINLLINPQGGIWSVSVPQTGNINPENLAGQVIDIGYFLDAVCDVVFDCGIWQPGTRVFARRSCRCCIWCKASRGQSPRTASLSL